MGDISKRGLDFIKEFEGYYDKAYLCPAGVWTIGWGSIRWSADKPVKKGDTCTPELAEKLLLKEVQRVEDAIDATIKVKLTQPQYDCLCSLFYNIGIGWLTGKGHQQATLVKLLNRGQYDKIPSEILKFKNANGKPLKGLIRRREAEVKQLWLGTYDCEPADDDDLVVMPQAVEPAKANAAAVVTQSKSIIASAFAIVMTLFQQVWEWTFGVAKEAAPQIAEHQTVLSPFSGLVTFLGANMGTLAAIVTIGVLAIIIQRRFSEERA